MDYETKPISRKKLRVIAKLIRSKYNIKTIEFPVIKILDQLTKDNPHDLFYVIEDDKEFDKNVMCYITQTLNEGYCIHIRNSVYIGAINNVGSCLGFICHELAHFILMHLFGFKAIINCETNPKRNIPYCKSVEWQAKALCGELMIPYEKCKNLDINEIIELTKSSEKQAKYFIFKVCKK